ncbi:hypothetical protein EG68_00195 [Paragonimus skrjabini miyazakii]|uniref:SSD domain-containing protein n=1 Tax=Paragonimus skrjabini miyazakii TaxID=59628 RepID=A0A8S9Z7C5_9TREM|nr:hypothetical protein EG68_00195 [Paragonimus skrjabini miyazakii]
MFPHWFIRNRYLFGICSFLFLICTTLVALLFCRLPDLTDPSADFVTIRTKWAAQVEQFKALLAETDHVPFQDAADLQLLSSLRMPRSTRSVVVRSHWVRSRKNAVNTWTGQLNFNRNGSLELCFGELYVSDPRSINLWATYANHGRLVVSLDNPVLMSTSADQLEISGSTAMDIFTQPDAFKSLCALQTRIGQLHAYKRDCVRAYRQHAQLPCCPMWSVPNMVAILLGVSSCEQVTAPQLSEVGQLLASCLPSFHRGTLRRSCWDVYGTEPSLLCPFVEPVMCLQSSIIPLLLATALPDNLNSSHSWRSTLLQLPVRPSNTLPLFLAIEAAHISGNLTREHCGAAELTNRVLDCTMLHLSFNRELNNSEDTGGIYLHAYNQLVSELLIGDTFWLGIGLGILLLLLGLGTRSVLLPLMTLLGIAWSLLVAYALYTQILRIPHFPVINFMAVVLAIGLGADDLLVYSQVWDQTTSLFTDHERRNVLTSTPSTYNLRCCSSSPNAFASRSRTLSPSFIIREPPPVHSVQTSRMIQLIQRISFTWSHAIPSMALTSFSTLLGLLVNLMSSIVAVQRFAVFSALIVLCNFVFVIIFTPVTLLLLDPIRTKHFSTACSNYTQFSNRISESFSRLVIRGRSCLPFLGFLILGFSAYQLLFERIFDWPRNGSKASSFLRPDHPFEVFMNEQSDRFWAERNMRHLSHLLEVHFVWGFEPQDDRSLWTYTRDPGTQTVTKWRPDPNVNLTSPTSRAWLTQFCDTWLKQLPYLARFSELNYRSESLASFRFSQLNPYLNVPLWCPVGRYANSLNNYIFAQACRESNSACCPSKSALNVIYSSATHFSACLAEYLRYAHHDLPREYHSGFRFPRNSSTLIVNLNEPVGFIITVLTNISVARVTHQELLLAVNSLNQWFDRVLATAPKSLAGGQMVLPGLGPFQVALNITEYLHWGLLSAVLMATVLVLLISGNVWITLLACLSLLTCLSFTIILLVVVDQWTLGIVEGLVVSLAAGLAIDPCIHMALTVSHMERLCYPRACHTRVFVIWSLNSVRRSMDLLNVAVTGSAWSTAMAGLSMIACQLLCYHQIGMFLVTLMISSWLCCYVLYASNLACLSSLSRFVLSRR